MSDTTEADPTVDVNAAGLALATTVADDYPPLVAFNILAAALGYTAASMVLHASADPQLRRSVLDALDSIAKNLKFDILRAERAAQGPKN